MTLKTFLQQADALSGKTLGNAAADSRLQVFNRSLDAINAKWEDEEIVVSDQIRPMDEVDSKRVLGSFKRGDDILLFCTFQLGSGESPLFCYRGAFRTYEVEGADRHTILAHAYDKDTWFNLEANLTPDVKEFPSEECTIYHVEVLRKNVELPEVRPKKARAHIEQPVLKSATPTRESSVATATEKFSLVPKAASPTPSVPTATVTDTASVTAAEFARETERLRHKLPKEAQYLLQPLQEGKISTEADANRLLRGMVSWHQERLSSVTGKRTPATKHYAHLVAIMQEQGRLLIKMFFTPVPNELIVSATTMFIKACYDAAMAEYAGSIGAPYVDVWHTLTEGKDALYTDEHEVSSPQDVIMEQKTASLVKQHHPKPQGKHGAASGGLGSKKICPICANGMHAYNECFVVNPANAKRLSKSRKADVQSQHDQWVAAGKPNPWSNRPKVEGLGRMAE
jgi:hypothetical protein